MTLLTQQQPWGWKRAVVVFLLAAGIYGLTAQRSIGWQDSGEYQWRTRQGDYLSQGGSRSHPLYIAVGNGISKLAGPEHDSHALNIFSGVMMAVGLAFLSAVLGRVGVSSMLNVALGTAICFSHVACALARTARVEKGYTRRDGCDLGRLFLFVGFLDL